MALSFQRTLWPLVLCGPLHLLTPFRSTPFAWVNFLPRVGRRFPARPLTAFRQTLFCLPESAASCGVPNFALMGLRKHLWTDYVSSNRVLGSLSTENLFNSRSDVKKNLPVQTFGHHRCFTNIWRCGWWSLFPDHKICILQWPLFQISRALILR